MRGGSDHPHALWCFTPWPNFTFIDCLAQSYGQLFIVEALPIESKHLTFQVIRRSIATLAQTMGSVKDIQGILRHSPASTTADVYMQEISEGVQMTLLLVCPVFCTG
jgi:hypothetical protein